MKALLILVPVALVFNACATDRAAEVRGERPFSVGLLGGGFRPTEEIGVNLNYVSYDAPLGWNSLDQLDDIQSRNFKSTGFGVAVSGIFFPWETSAFNVGAGVEYVVGKGSFDADDALSDAKKDRINVEYYQSSTKIGVPLGWYWIWENGVTVSLDFGPRLRVSNDLGWNDDGGEGVNTSQRNKFRSDRTGSAVSWGGAGLIGYSF